MLVEVNYLKDQVGPIHACAYKVPILILGFSLLGLTQHKKLVQ
jgi:hypothetical protein